MRNEKEKKKKKRPLKLGIVRGEDWPGRRLEKWVGPISQGPSLEKQVLGEDIFTFDMLSLRHQRQPKN